MIAGAGIDKGDCNVILPILLCSILVTCWIYRVGYHKGSLNKHHNWLSEMTSLW